MRHIYDPEHIDTVLKRLADACQKASDHKAIADICTAVANLVGLTNYGSTTALSRIADLMHMATKHGFASEFYGNGVRVSYTKPLIGTWRVVPSGTEVLSVGGVDRGHTWKNARLIHEAQRYAADGTDLEKASYTTREKAKAWIEDGARES